MTNRPRRSEPKPPWKKPPPARGEQSGSHHLSETQKASARRSARRAGRTYPNLIDNMHAAQRGKKGTRNG